MVKDGEDWRGFHTTNLKSFAKLFKRAWAPLREEGFSLNQQCVILILILTAAYFTNTILIHSILEFFFIVINTIDYFLQDHTTIPCDPTKWPSPPYNQNHRGFYIKTFSWKISSTKQLSFNLTIQLLCIAYLITISKEGNTKNAITKLIRVAIIN